MGLSPLREKFWYLAHPFTVVRDNPYMKMFLEQQNVNAVTKIAAELISRGVLLYSPLTMTYPIHLIGVGMGYWGINEYKLWMKVNKPYLKACDGIILCGDYMKSKGCVLEEEYFEKEGKFSIDLEAFKALLDIEDQSRKDPLKECDE